MREHTRRFYPDGIRETWKTDNGWVVLKDENGWFTLIDYLLFKVGIITEIPFETNPYQVENNLEYPGLRIDEGHGRCPWL